jgi:membrane protein
MTARIRARELRTKQHNLCRVVLLALAYYSIFSVGPVIVIAIAVAGLIFGQDAVRGEVSAQIRALERPAAIPLSDQIAGRR